MHEYEISILNLLKEQRKATLQSILSKTNISKDSALWAIENLASKGLAKVERKSESIPKLTKEGQEYVNRFPEEKLLTQIEKSEGHIQISKVHDNISLIWAKKNGWVKLAGNELSLTAEGKEIANGKKIYDYRQLLGQISSLEVLTNDINDVKKEEIQNLIKRNLLEIKEHNVIKSIEITEKGMRVSESEPEGIGMLTREMITKGTWKKEGIRKYDINTPTEEMQPARMHPLHEFLDIIRQIWLNMGFTEVSGPIIEPAFWVFDALFSPQDHPTREMQDTFFLKNPSSISVDDLALMKRVKKMHQSGWKEKWQEEISQQAVLRTHTTSVSARSINKYANLDEKSYPLKLFTVGRNFRNENIDYKHLAEFYMFEGIIIGNNLTLSNLIYTLKQFYSQLGMENLVFKPAYFPFVEPGLEICYYDEKKKDTIELGGAGIIRKEITRAMGTKKTVLAWGPGLDRLMFKAFDIDSLTELYKNEVRWLRKRKELKL